MPARDGKAGALRPFCENVPDLPANHPETYGTIPTVIYFADKPLEHSVFATPIPSGTRACTGAVALAPYGYAGQTSPSLPYLRRRYLPRREREALGEESAS